MNTNPEWPIEPLSDAAWKRIEQRVFEQVSVPAPMRETTPWFRRRFMWGTLAVCSLAACLLVFSWRPEARFASRPAAPSTRHYAATGSTRQLDLPEMTVQLEAQSELASVSHGVYRLAHGAARFDVVHRGTHDPLAILAGNVRVEVVGTVFRVACVSDAARVETYAGTVRVIQANHVMLVRAGEHWDPAELAGAESTATIPTRTPAVPVEARSTSSPSALQATAPRSADVDLKTRVQVSERQRRRFELAAAHEKRDPERALRIYEALSREPGPWAGNALFALGRLELEHEQPLAAARDLRRYLERYPAGANAVDAHTLLARLVPDGSPAAPTH
jgi:hypothetical protein